MIKQFNFSQARTWLVFLAMGLTVFMVDVDMTAINSAMTSMAEELALNLSASEWVINGYLIAAASLMAFAGRVSDIYGPRNVFLIGMVAFIVCSLGAAIAIDPYTICIARFLQGACMAFIFPLTIIIAKGVFPSERQGFLIGLLISIAGISQAMGPSFGGIFISWLGWRPIFLVNIPLGIIVIAIVLRYVSENNTVVSKKQLAALSVSLFVGALMLLMFVINHVHANNIPKLWLGCLLIASVIMLVIFSWLESGSELPLLEITLLKNGNFLILNSIRSVTQITYFGILFMLGMLLENTLQINVFYAGAIISSLTLTFGVASLFTGRLADRYGNLSLMLIGLVLMLLGYLGLAFMWMSDGSLTMLIVALAFIGLASALLLPPMTNSIAKSVLPEQIGSAMGLYFTNGYFSAAIGVGFAGSFINSINTKESFINTFSQFMWLCTGLLALTLFVCIFIGAWNVSRGKVFLKSSF